jgi:hypothetical protein
MGNGDRVKTGKDIQNDRDKTQMKKEQISAERLTRFVINVTNNFLFVFRAP